MSLDYISTALRFIRLFRDVEIAPRRRAHNIIKCVIQDEYTAAHLCHSWNGRKQDFGDFYLNLSRLVQYQILKYWDLVDPAGEKYAAAIQKDEIATLFLDVPKCILWPSALLKFFNNHGIAEECERKILLPHLPAPDRRFGNSGNWADYILSLPPLEQERVLCLIADHSLEQ